jgi:hypothetical protein
MGGDASYWGHIGDDALGTRILAVFDGDVGSARQAVKR